MAGKYTRARAPLARMYTNRTFESKDGTTGMKIVNQIERHKFYLNELLNKSSRTEIQSNKVEERTFGTPCRYVPPHWVGFLRRFGLKTGIHFAQFGLESGMAFEGTTGVYERLYRFNSK